MPALRLLHLPTLLCVTLCLVLSLLSFCPASAQTPFLGSPVSVSATSATTIEAKNYDNGGPGVA